MFTKNKSKFIEQNDALINMLASKHIQVIEGSCAKTDGSGRIWLPRLPESATEKDFVRYFCHGGHEVAHIQYKSDVKGMRGTDPKYAKLRASLVNIVDDIRVENQQEVEYPGWKIHRKIADQSWLDDTGYEKFRTASKSNMQGFIHALGCLAIMRVRCPHLDLPIDFELSDELKKAYDKYVKDLEPDMDAQVTSEDSMRLADILLERIKKMIEDDVREPEDPKDTDGSDESDGTDESEDTGESDESDGTDESEDTGESDEPEDTDDTGESDESDDTDDSDDTGESYDTDESDDTDDDRELTDEEKAEVEKTLEDLNDSDMKTTVEDDLTESINKIAEESDEYKVMPGVKDSIEYATPDAAYSSDSLRSEGFEILGTAGSKMTRYFVSNTRSRTLRYQEHGRLDMPAINADLWDTKKSVFYRRTKGRLDKAALSIMIDNSGSMNGIRIVKSYAIINAMAYYLNRACIPTEIAGFTADIAKSDTWRDVPVYIQIVKKFEDRYDRNVINRCVPPSYRDQNAEVDCMRWMVPRLMKRPEAKKILFIFGDGDPFIGNYYLNIKLAKAYKNYIDRCREVGIIVVGFGIDCDLSQYFGDDYINVESSTMGIDIINKLRQILNR